MDREAGKGHPYCQGINAGGDGQEKHGACLEGGIQVFLLRKGFPDHISSNKNKEAKGDPMVDLGNGGGKEAAEKIADQWHQCLKTAKPQTGDRHMFYLDLSQGEPLADRDSKGIHGEPHSQYKEFQCSHDNLISGKGSSFPVLLHR